MDHGLDDSRGEPLSGKDEVVTYSDSKVAFFFKADGSGFAYYHSGRVAVVVSNVSSYQNRYYFYDNDHKNSLVAAIDELGIGFVMENRKGSKCRMVLMKRRGILTDAIGTVVREGPWTPNLADPGPFPEVTIKLTSCLTFKFVSRMESSVTFTHEGLKRVFNTSVRLKRYSSYLENAVPILGSGGKLSLNGPFKTLVERTHEFNEQMQEKRSRLHPRSQDLSLSREVVAALERDFDGYEDKCSRAVAYLRAGWKEEAHQLSRTEVPQLTATGQETGTFPGFSEAIYLDAERVRREGLERVRTFKVREALVWPDGRWKTDLDLRSSLMAENPLLPRSHVLCAASGRYCKDLVVPGGHRSATNPQGKAEAVGERLTRLDLSTFDGNFDPYARPDQLLVLVCTRADEPTCHRAEKVCETLLQYLHSTPGDGRGAELLGTALGRIDAAKRDDFALFKVEMTESRAFTKRFNVLTLPQFLMFLGGRLVYQGMLGGEARRITSRRRAKAPVVLLAEPNFKQQILTEKLLRKMECKWDLCMSARGALQIRQATPTKTYDLVLLSDQLPIEDVKEIERNFGASKPTTVLAGMATVSGEEGAEKVKGCSWKKGLTFDVNALFDDASFASSVEVGITHPVKSLAMESLINHTITRRGADGWDRERPEYVGTTTLELYDQMCDALERGRRGSFIKSSPELGLVLSAEEMKVRGTILKRQTQVYQADGGIAAAH